jgi:hypothetical protein
MTTHQQLSGLVSGEAFVHRAGAVCHQPPWAEHLAIAGWMLLFAALGWALLRSTPRP